MLVTFGTEPDYSKSFKINSLSYIIMVITHIRKRSEEIVLFDPDRIRVAIGKAAESVGVNNKKLEKELTEKVVQKLENNFSNKIPDVEAIQDIVENTLIDEGQVKIAKSYILYRQKRAEMRKEKENILGKKIETKFSKNALMIIKEKYLIKTKKGEIKESPQEMFMRVARIVAEAEKAYGKSAEEIDQTAQEFYEMMYTMQFIPGGRVLANAGVNNQLCNCFVLPLEDSTKKIFASLYTKAILQRLGGGSGFSFSKLRHKGSKAYETDSIASGPIAFLKLFDYASSLIIQSGNRRTANMGSLSIHHPDIIDFITCKDNPELLTNFNVSVEITDEFMNAVMHNLEYDLIDPSSNKELERLDARKVFSLFVTMAWKNGDPGVLFIDKLNQNNPLKETRMETTDPCGEQPLLPYEGIPLGGINLSLMVKNNDVNWDLLKKTVHTSVRFLDNIIGIVNIPVEEVQEIIKKNRRIGLGIMGFADMLYQLKIPYNSVEGENMAEKVMKFIQKEAYNASEKLAHTRGNFPNWDKSIYQGKRYLRNLSLTCISPTGTRSLIADTSPGIEPNFYLIYQQTFDKNNLLKTNPHFINALKQEGCYSDELLYKIAQCGSIRNMKEIPIELRKVFVVAHDISAKWHIRMQAAFQKNIDGAISKTINFPKNAAIKEIEDAYIMAYNLGCKGMTVYRDGCRDKQVINL